MTYAKHTPYHHEDGPASSLFYPVSERDIAALINPRPVVLIGAQGAQEEIGFATVAWITPISHDPALLVFALRERSYTFTLLQQTRFFSVCTLTSCAEGIALVKQCGNTTGHTIKKGDCVPHILVPATPASKYPSKSFLPSDKFVQSPRKVPVAHASLSWLTCSVDDIRPAGDHMLVTGAVQTAYSRAPRDKRKRIDPVDTLLCLQHDRFASAHHIEVTPP